jgi:hypothetical protein
MQTIQASMCVTENPSKLFCDASEAGFKPMQWPQFVTVVQEADPAIPFTEVFIKGTPEVFQDQFMGFNYANRKNTRTLFICND